ncbi:MAG: protein-methionine-sulfoxide reductase catalytic subunit MsrP [Rhodobacterales bacterium]|nr:MAG: protein-methionine-sulfoxide reductase catalytic subunit MsrP [Rhodobacterales bacterium]
MAFKPDLKYSDITPHTDFLNRRQLIAGLGLGAVGLGALPSFAASPYSTDEKPNSLKQISNYNNFYEFGTRKTDPADYADTLTTDPWSVKIDGLVERPGRYDLADILAKVDVEERIYRLRCVETWSMVVPWNGFQLSQLLDRVGVLPSAKYVYFETLVRPEEMRGQKRKLLDWPYREGLRLDEAMHPLTLMATGLYGEELPKANGAPLRLVVPWKYGYKSIKSVVRIKLVDKQPRTTWNDLAPDEYGFYSNVNPKVSHPRWSQATERRIGGGFFAKRRDTLMFNGYADQVASLYKGMDLKVHH